MELLECIAPRTGRPLPVGSQANDLWYWQINLRVADPAAFEELLRKSHYAFVSTRVTELNDAALGWQAGIIVRDPDGHAILIARGVGGR